MQPVLTPSLPQHYRDFLANPMVYGVGYMIIAVVCIVLLLACVVGTIIATLPYQTLKKNPLTRDIALWYLRRGTLKRIEKIEKDLASGRLTLHAAHDRLDKTVRTFLLIETNLPVLHMHKDEISHSILAPYLSIISLTDTGRFSKESDPGVLKNSHYLKELVEGWGR